MVLEAAMYHSESDSLAGLKRKCGGNSKRRREPPVLASLVTTMGLPVCTMYAAVMCIHIDRHHHAI